jgi:hypothetical protein
VLDPRREPQRVVPTEQDFADARSALATNRSVGRVHFGRGVTAPHSVRGESNYQHALKLLRRHRNSGGRLPALLVREPDSRNDENAVALMVYGHTVGYLSRDDVADLADHLDELADSEQFLACPASLVDGTADKPNIGVVVFLREAFRR